jgi:hypothetical protein
MINRNSKLEEKRYQTVRINGNNDRKNHAEFKTVFTNKNLIILKKILKETDFY